jgi:hypothetical protein
LARCLPIVIGLVMIGGGVFVRYAGVLAAVAPGTTIRNGDMEELFVGGVAFGWDNNCWGDAVAAFSKDTQNPRSGRSAQQIRLERVTQGAAQIRQLGITVRAGQPYTLSLWLRGSVDSPVFVGIRQNEAPYKRYLMQNVRVTPEWRRFVICGTPTEDGLDAGIYLSLKTPGDLWIDDVELKEGEPEPAHVTSAQPVRKGNLLYNSGFELGADGWGPVARLKVDTAGAAQGRLAARCTPDWERILIESRPVVVRPGQLHTVSASLKASGPAEVELVMMEYADDGGHRPGPRDSIRQTFKIQKKWQRVSLSGVLRAPFVNGYLLQISLRSGSGPVWVDAVQWEEGPPTAYRPAAPVEAAVRAPSRFLRPGQAAVTGCRVYRASGAPKSAVTVRLEDSEGRIVAQQNVAAPVTKAKVARQPAAAPVQSARLTWKLPRPGIYRVVAAPAGTPVGRTGQTVFCLFSGGPRTSTAPRIGIHGWADPKTPNSALQAASFLGAGQFRLHDFRSFVQWHEVEPSAGQFAWYDRDVEDLSRRGYRLMGTLCRPPLWAGRDDDGHVRHRGWTSSPPRDGKEWDRYVTAVVRRYRGQIRAWEVWNEPWAKGFWSGTPAEYAQLLARTRRTIKTADPEALVIGGSFSPEFPQFTQEVFQAGGLEAMDVVSYHDYLEPPKVEEPARRGAPSFYHTAAGLRDQIRRRGGAQPLWCTETGVRCPGFFSWLPKQGPAYSGQVAVETLVKGLTLALAGGAERIYYYHMGGLEWEPGYPSRMLNGAYTLLDYDGSPKPTLPALAQLVAMLGDSTAPADLTTPALRAYLFQRQESDKLGRFVAVVWARGETPVRLQASGASVRALDPMGAAVALPAAVAQRPVYLLSDSREALVKLVTSNE